MPKLSLAAVATTTALLFALVTAQLGLAQTARPSGATQGTVQGGTYTHPQAGYSFTLPTGWLQNGYKWYEYWGDRANQVQPGARFISDWVYAPKNAALGESSLLVLTVYGKDAWDKIEAQVGPRPGEALAESGDHVYVVTLSQANPYPQGSADAAAFDKLLVSLAQARQAFAASGAPTRPATGGTVTITEKDNGSQVTLKQNDTLVVTLAANTSTGFSWQAAANPLLQPLGDPQYVRPADAPPGAGGLQTFRFQATATGQTTLRMEYRRPFEPNAAPARTFSVQVTIN